MDWGGVMCSRKEIGWRVSTPAAQPLLPADALRCPRHVPRCGQRGPCLSPPPAGRPHRPLPSRWTGSSGRTHASQTMTSCGQQSLNTLAVLSLLISAGRASVGAQRAGRVGAGSPLPGPCQPSQGSGRCLRCP